MIDSNEIEKDENRNVNCEVCYEALSRKCSVQLGNCGHELHQSCLVNWIETIKNKPCPVCNNRNAYGIRDEDCNTLPEIFYWGPTGQPTQQFLASSLDDTSFEYRLDRVNMATAKWMLVLSQQIWKARTDGKSDEYMQDIVDQKRKLLKRMELLDKMHDDLAAIRQRMQLTDQLSSHVVASAVAVAATPDTSAINEAAPVVQPDASQTEQIAASEASEANDVADACAVCLELLPIKRTETFQLCNRTLHRTCAIKWIEALKKAKLLNTQENIKVTCCLCRSNFSKLVDAAGKVILQTSPVELYELDTTYTTGAYKDMKRHINAIGRTYSDLANQRKVALRDGKNVEYIADIDEEMDKLRRRWHAVDSLYLIFEEAKRSQDQDTTPMA